MATKSYAEDNNPEADNRSEYTPPPCMTGPDESCRFDENGLEVDENGDPVAGR